MKRVLTLILIVVLAVAAFAATNANAAPSADWDKSSIKLTGGCAGSEACFTISNTGRAMEGTSQWRVYVDGVLTDSGNFQLGAGESEVFCFSYPGHSVRFEADQRPGHPGNSHPKLTLNCGGDQDTPTPTATDRPNPTATFTPSPTEPGKPTETHTPTPGDPCENNQCPPSPTLTVTPEGILKCKEAVGTALNDPVALATLAAGRKIPADVYELCQGPDKGGLPPSAGKTDWTSIGLSVSGLISLVLFLFRRRLFFG